MHLGKKKECIPPDMKDLKLQSQKKRERSSKRKKGVSEIARIKEDQE